MLYDLIDKKVIDYAEIVIVLFDYCNLKCAFCPQEHDSFEYANEEDILSKVKPVTDWINSNDRSTYFKLHIMGGEVFEDNLVDDGFLDIYEKLMSQIRDNVPSEKHIQFNFVTNLVYNKPNRILDFLNKHDLKVSSSYDPSGRFNTNEFEVFKKNVELFKDRIEMFSIVMTRQNINRVINRDSYYDYLYNNFTIDWDSFIPAVEGKVPERMMPSESELLEFYKVLVDNYPKCLNVEHFTGNKDNYKMTCTRGNSFTILKNNHSPGGCSGAMFLKDAKTKDLEAPIILQQFFDEYNCFTCEFYNKCPFTCFIKNDYSKIEKDLGKCVFKETFKYVENRVHKSTTR